MVESTNNELNEVVKISYNIFQLYNKLSYAEIKYGKDSDQYKKISSYIEISAEAENEYFESIFKNEKTLSIFRKFWDESFSRRTVNPFQNYFCTLEKDKDSKTYTKKIASRVQSELELRVNYTYLSNEVNLNILKNYVLLLDKYISDCRNRKMKSKLIKEKNNIISSNKSLESWYLGFEKNNMKCSIIDNNIIESYLLGIGIEDYITFKQDYLIGFCRSIVNHILLCQMDEFDKVIGEVRLLAVLLDMDCVTLGMNYNSFQDLITQRGFKNQNSDLVDGSFSKCPELVKKKNNYKI